MNHLKKKHINIVQTEQNYRRSNHK